jgi:hypothetical protein
MIPEKRFQSKDEIELLELWMKSPPWDKPTLPDGFVPEAILKDLQLAHKWLLEHGGSTKLVWPMLYKHHKALGEQYSMDTARRRVNDAQRLFVTISHHQTRWTAGFLLDECLEMLRSAKNDRKLEAAAKLLREARDYIKLINEYIREDAERITEPIAIDAVFDPAEAGIQYDPNARKHAEEWLRLRKEKLSKFYGAHAQDAIISEVAPTQSPSDATD